MKHRIYLFLCFFALGLYSPLFAQQFVFEEDFEDGDFTQNPEWVGDVDEWIIIDEDGNNRLRLNGDGAGVSHLSSESLTSHGVWEFFVRLDGFTTSDNNRAHVFLMSDRADTEANVNGYAIRIGESGSDKFFRIVRFDNGISGASRVLVTGTTLIEENTGYQVKAIRSPDGEWSLFVSSGYGSEPQLEGTPAIDTTYDSSSFIGIRTTYTTTRAENFFFDDIRVAKEPPQALSINVINPQIFDITFSEPIDPESVSASSFTINNDIGEPVSAELENESTVRITFENDLPAGSYEMSISGIRDLFGVEMNPQVLPFDISTLGEFSLLSPEDDSTLITISGSSSVVEFSWNTSNGADTYEWLAILPDGSFEEPLLALQANNNGASTLLSQTLGELDDFLVANDIEPEESLDILWTVKAMAGDDQRFAENPFRLTLERSAEDIGDIAEPGDVVINEFWYDEPDDLAQYVEIFNATETKTFNLKDWSIGNSTGSPGQLTDEDFILEPGDFIVITPDSTALFNRFGNRPYIESTDFQELSRSSSGMIRLLSPEETEIDFLQYTPEEWGGEGVALERKSVDAISYAQDNWTESTDALGGTPGLQNTAEPDPDPLIITNVTFRNTTSVNVIFDRHIDKATATDGGNYSINNDIQILEAEKVGHNIVRLTLNNPLLFDISYTLTSAGIESIFGVPMPVQNFDFSFEEPDEVVMVIDDFEDGDFTQNPEWLGDAVNWEILPFDGNNRLSLNALDAGSSYLSTESPTNYGTWEFMIQTKYATSNNNRAHVFLMSDRLNITESVNGYAVRVGESGSSKFFRIVRFDDGEMSEILVTGSTLIEANTDYQIKVTRNREGEWQLFVSTGYGTEPQPEGEPVVDNTYANAAWFGIMADYTSTRLDLVNIDDVRISKLPLFLTQVQVLDAQNLNVIFSEAVDPASVSTASFSINQGIGEPESFIVSDNSIQITYPNPIPGGVYDLNVSGIRDLTGATMEPESITFNLINEPESGDLVINEFFYDNPSEFSQYVEIFNTSNDKLFNLKNWSIRDNTATSRLITSEDVLLWPGERLVLTDDVNGLINQFGEQNYLELSSFPALNRSTTDQVRIFEQNNATVDSLEYTPSQWGGSGVALERRSATAPSVFAENWAESTAPNGGTPGQANTTEPDPNPLTVLAVTPTHSTAIEIRFDRSFLPSSALNDSNYEIPGIAIQEIVLSDQQTIELVLSTPLTPNTTYELTIQNVESIFGIPLPQTTESFLFLEFIEPDFNDLVINEFLYRPVNGEIPRFIEIFNRSNKDIDIHNWRIGRSSTTIILQDDSGHIPIRPGEFLVITDDPELLELSESQTVIVPSMLALSQNGDSIFMRTSDEVLIDSLHYSPDWGGSPSGFSLERIDFLGASNDASNWKTHPENNSAGSENSNFKADETPPELIFSKRMEDTLIEVRFNEFIQIDDNTIFQLGSTSLTITEFNPFTANRVLLQSNTSSAFQSGNSDEIISVQNIADVPGNVTDQLSIPIAQPFLPGDVVINEIMYQPISGRYNDFPDQSEYVEFYNRRDYAINLEGFYIHDQPDRDGNVSSIFPVSSQSAWIPANGFAVLYPEEEADFENARISQFFELDDNRFFYRTDRTTLSLSTQGRAVFLANADDIAIDSVSYLPDWHNPNLVDTQGISLERINPNGNSNDESNWGSNILEQGGSPGSQNSLLAFPEEFPTDENIIVEPNPFSPDADGEEDNLFINYALNEPDYLMRVRIFDRYGRLIRVLADGIPAGFEGTLTWDGRRENGMENRIGIYIIHFEAFNSSSGKNRTFKKTAILARKL